MKGLIADVDGTHARFSLVDEAGRVTRTRVLLKEEYRGIADAVRGYLTQEDVKLPRIGAFAVASAVTGDRVTSDNQAWDFSIKEVQQELGLEHLDVVNDFTANALALRRLKPDDRRQVGSGSPIANTPIGIVGPSAGLGISGLVPARDGSWIPITGEGGHATMSPSTEREAAVLNLMRKRFDHVSAEHCISEQGLVSLYNALCELDGVRAAAYSPTQVADPQVCASDGHCLEALGMFCAMLGTVAGNLALTLGAHGGVFIAGSIVPRMGNLIEVSQFRPRFEAKGRFQSFLTPIPTYVVTHPSPVSIGLAGLIVG
jgi:glucokinase